MDLRAGIVRILVAGGKMTAGTGFVITEKGHIATCAHVVELAGSEPGDTVSLVFHATKEGGEATVEPEYWTDPSAEDVAILQLGDSNSLLPDGVEALPLASSLGSEGHSFKTFGFSPAKPVEGMPGEGNFIGWTKENDCDVLQLHSWQVTRGFSGAPTLDTSKRRVVGMVVSIAEPDEWGRQAGTGYIVPTETVKRVCPDVKLSDDYPQRDINILTKKNHNLPASRTSFVGREQEMAEVKSTMAKTRLLTLTGAGGSGKTRLALQLARDLVGSYPDGVWLIELAPISEGNSVPQEVARALGVSEQPGHPITDTLTEALRTKNMLLIMDNCEHLVDSVVYLLDTLLDSCPYLRILATSRELLGVDGEVRWEVPSLTLPGQLRPLSVAELEEFEATRLFIERASVRYRSFALKPEDTQAVAEICRHLDGIPLAIELAAARVETLSVQQISARLKDSLKLLTGGARTALRREKSLLGALDWSYDLLAEPQRMLFGRLSVFADGCTLEAVESVCAGDGIEESEVLDLLSDLEHKSLVIAEREGHTEMRYRLLEPVRLYGLEKLDSREYKAIRRRHAEYFLALAEDAESSPRKYPLERMEEEHSNLRASLWWSFESEATERGLRLAVALERFWSMRGYLSEGRMNLKKSLERGGAAPATIRAEAYLNLGWLALLQGDYKSAEAAYQESLSLYHDLNDAMGEATALRHLGTAARLRGDRARAKRHLERSLLLLRELGVEREIASTLNHLGGLALDTRELTEAESLFKKALALSRKVGDPQTVAVHLENLGYTMLLRGDPRGAIKLLEESLAFSQELGDDLANASILANLALATLALSNHERATALGKESLRLARQAEDKPGITECLEILAAVAGAWGRAQRAAQLWGAARTLREDIGVTLQPDQEELLKRYLDSTLGQLKEKTGQEAWELAWKEGQAMALEEAIEYAFTEDGPSPPASER